MPSVSPTSTPNARPHGHGHAGVTRLLPALLALLLVLAPLFRAGVMPLASLALQLLALGILTASLWTPRAQAWSRLELGLLAALPACVILYLIPLPTAWVDALPGRALYGGARALLSDPTVSTWTPLSLNPIATRNAGLALLVPIAVFVGARRLDRRALLGLAHLLLGIAAIEALLGLIQFATAQYGQLLFAPAGTTADSAIGTYANHNHLAGLLEMAMPLTLALLFASLGPKATHRPRGNWRQRAAFLGSRHGGRVILYAGTALLLLLGIVFTRSRMGIAMAMLGLVLTTVLLAGRVTGRNPLAVTGTFFIAVLALGFAVGLTPVLTRFALDIGADGRNLVFAATLTGIGQHLPLGTGPGTFTDAIRALQPAELGARFINRAHNDYLEWTSDVGLIAPIVIVLALSLYLRQWLRVYTRGEWTRTRFLQAGAGIGLLALALHELVDYNLYTPANQAVFALLAGIFFMPTKGHEDPPEQPNHYHRSRHRQGPGERVPDRVPDGAGIRAASPPPDQIENPFKD